MLNEVMRNQDHYGRSFRDKLTETVIAMITETLDEDLKQQITERAKDEIVKKYIRTKQYKELKNELDIYSDKEIESGLNKIIYDISRKELKKMFK